MEDETQTFYYIVVLWVLLVLLGSLMQKCCASGVIRATYANHYEETYNEAQPGDEIWSITGNLRSSDFTSDGSLTIDQITIINQDKPPSYNEDPPTYDQAIRMAKANNIPIPHAFNSSEEEPKPAQ